jgi:hypothetical protein
VALPNEHGGWGFTVEPVVLGMLVAPGWAGVGLGMAAVMAFLARHPLTLWLSDLRRGKRYARTGLAAFVAAGYLAAGATGLLLAAGQARSAAGPWAFLWPIGAAVPLAGLRLYYDARSAGRSILPEFAGAVAMGSVAAAIVLAGDAPLTLAVGLWLVLAMRALASLYFARTQVQRARGMRVSPKAAYVAEGGALAALAVAAALGLVPWLSVLAIGLLLAYSVYSFGRPSVPARLVGWSQMAFGLLVVAMTAAGVRFGF